MSKAARQRTARDRLAEDRRRHAERQQRLRALAITLGALAVIAVVVVGFVVIQSNRSKPTGYQGPLAPLSRQDDGSIVMAKAGVTGPVLEIFEDFQCPACKNFEATNGDTLKRLAAEGKVKVVYRPFRLFQDEPLKSNSQRAANAAACAPADRWVTFHDVIYRNQPAEGTVGFSEDDLITWGKEAGITGAAFEKCVRGGGQHAKVEQATQLATSAGIQSTPTLNLNGSRLGDEATYTKEGLEKAIRSAGTSPPAGLRTTPATTTATPARTSSGNDDS